MFLYFINFINCPLVRSEQTCNPFYSTNFVQIVQCDFINHSGLVKQISSLKKIFKLTKGVHVKIHVY